MEQLSSSTDSWVFMEKSNEGQDQSISKVGDKERTEVVSEQELRTENDDSDSDGICVIPEENDILECSICSSVHEDNQEIPREDVTSLSESQEEASLILEERHINTFIPISNVSKKKFICITGFIFLFGHLLLNVNKQNSRYKEFISNDICIKKILFKNCTDFCKYGILGQRLTCKKCFYNMHIPVTHCEIISPEYDRSGIKEPYSVLKYTLNNNKIFENQKQATFLDSIENMEGEIDKPVQQSSHIHNEIYTKREQIHNGKHKKHTNYDKQKPLKRNTDKYSRENVKLNNNIKNKEDLKLLEKNFRKVQRNMENEENDWVFHRAKFRNEIRRENQDRIRKFLELNNYIKNADDLKVLEKNLQNLLRKVQKQMQEISINWFIERGKIRENIRRKKHFVKK